MQFERLPMNIEQVSRHCYAVINSANRLCDSNSGFINADGGIVIDTQGDLPHARKMLQLVNTIHPDSPRRVINTHEDSDHVWGNQLFEEVEIIGHRCLPERMREVADPTKIQQLTRAARHPLLRHVLRITKPALFALGRQLNEHYDFTGIIPTPPTVLFDRQTKMNAGPVTVELIHVGPCHQAGDTIVHVPEDRVVFAGDLLFAGCTPMGWSGTHQNWNAALDMIAGLKPERIVPGHGPVCGLKELQRMSDYLRRVDEAAQLAFEAGMTAETCARQFSLDDFADWNAPCRLSMNVARAYRELVGDPPDRPWDVPAVFGSMYRLAEQRRWPTEF